MRLLRLLYQFLSTEQPPHTQNLFPQMRNFYRHPNTFNVFSCGTEFFKSSLFPYLFNKWNVIDPNIHRSNNYDI